MTIYVFFDSYPNVYQRVSPNLKMFIFIPPADGMTIPMDQLTGLLSGGVWPTQGWVVSTYNAKHCTLW